MGIALEHPERLTLVFTGEEIPDIEDPELDEWFCIQTDEAICTACGKLWTFVHFKTLITVWPKKDDANILRFAEFAVHAELNPKIVEYEQSFGDCISYYETEQDG